MKTTAIDTMDEREPEIEEKRVGSVSRYLGQ